MIKPRQNLALQPLTTFGVVGTAARAWQLDELGLVDPLLEALAPGRSAGAAPSPRPFILGGGSNVLFARDLAEPLILVRLRGRRRVDDDGENVLLEVAAGENWDETVRFSLSQGWYGLENLSLIPGLMGGAPWQNIGAYGVEVSRLIDSVDAVHLGNGERRTFAAADCGFGYRSSFFKTPLGREWLITAVRLRLSRRPQPFTGYPDVEQEVAALATLPAIGSSAGARDRFDGPSPEQVAAAVCALRRRKLPDPAEIGNAGSFFKNPIISRERLESLRTTHPKMPFYPVADEPQAVKLSAGWLIEAAGWKGFREGDAGVSSRHALVLVNHGAATGRQILALARRIERTVFEGFGVTLEPEPVIVA
jgi:UDP-N-acetylmuramate dehydrogenase